MYRAIIIDDEQVGLNTLKLMVEKHTKELKVVATATSAEEGVRLIGNYRPEVVFLDISMPGMDGFELLEQLDYKDFKLVFTTAHEEFAVRAIKRKAFDYLLKPIDATELRQCVDNILSSAKKPEQKQAAQHVIELSVRDGIIFIGPKDIIRLEADGSYTTFYLENNVKHVASKNLKECESLLTAPYFYRCHPSHLVNLKKVLKLVSSDGLFALMSDGSMPEVGRKYKEQLLEKLKTL